MFHLNSPWPESYALTQFIAGRKYTYARKVVWLSGQREKKDVEGLKPNRKIRTDRLGQPADQQTPVTKAFLILYTT